MKPLISVCIPTFNQDKFIGETIESILSQSYKNFELIVVNSQSTDNTEKEVKKYMTDPRLKYLLCQYNTMSFKLNMAFRLGTGRYLTWVASDDKYKKDYLKKMSQSAFESDADVTYTSFERWRYDKKGLCGYDQFKSKKMLLDYQDWGGYKKLLTGNVCSCFMLFKRSIFEKVGGFNDIVFCDWDLVIRMAEAGAKFEYVKERLGIIRVHGESDSSKIKITKEGIKGCYKIWQAVINRREDNEESLAVTKKINDMKYIMKIKPEEKEV